IQVAPPRSSKRSYLVANIKERLEELKPNLANEEDGAEEDKTAMKKFNRQRRQAIEELMDSNSRDLSADLNKLLMIQGIMKIDFKTNADFAAYAKEKKQDKYGNPRRLPLSLKQELEEALEDFRDDGEFKKLKKKLMLINIDLEGVEERVVSVLLSLLDHMTVGKKQANEMRIQSGALSSICHLFKLSMNHDAHGYNKILFDTDALKNRCPDYIVEVGTGEDDLIVNLVAEVKGENSKKSGVSLDTYRLGLFGLHMLWKYKLKNSLVLQVEGMM
ncbi:hypothetical protein A0J61_11551, partial [Choanephora cucurbitarum]